MPAGAAKRPFRYELSLNTKASAASSNKTIAGS